MSVQDIESNPIAGQAYHLMCNVSGQENLDVHTLTYQWTKHNGTTTHIGTNSDSLVFSSLVLSDSGEYTCTVTVSSSYLKEDEVARSMPYSLDVPRKVVICSYS